MAPASVPGEPRVAPKPEPLGNVILVILFTTCTLCALFLLWRRASSIKTIVAHRLQTWTRREGAIRLSSDDGPASHEFLSDDYDEDNEAVADDEPLSLTTARLKAARHQQALTNRPDEPHSTSTPPLPPHTSET